MEDRARQHEVLIGKARTAEAALQHVIAAAELYVQAVGDAGSRTERTRLRRRCDALMSLGEQLKAAGNDNGAVVDTVQEAMAALAALTVDETTRPTPTSALPSTRTLSNKEQIVLLKSSRLHGTVFPPWDGVMAAGAFQLGPGEAIFVDDTVFSMSPQQRAVFAGWKRPMDLMLDVFSDTPPNDLSPPSSYSPFSFPSSLDLVQDITSDCSVVAGLCALARHPAAPALLAAALHPWGYASANGKYVVRLHLNGTDRRVIIDDRLPATTPTAARRSLFVVDRRHPRMLWPALLEKAYLKVHGGYDFPGSNSGTDLWVLTGWIPEQLFVGSAGSKDEEDDADADSVTWSRICSAFARGDVMATLGTGRLSPDEEAHLGLAGEHDYAVLAVHNDDDGGGGRRMLVKNPWVDSLVWHKPATPATPDDDDNNALTGTFWMAWDDVVQYFESVYLNWNPALFAHKEDRHMTWTLPDAALGHTLADNPQFVLRPAADGPVWILLSRHLQDAELERVRRHKRWQNEDVDNATGFMALAVCATAGRRVLLPPHHPHEHLQHLPHATTPAWLRRGPLVDARQTLVRIDHATRGTAYTVVVCQRHLPLTSYSLTLSFFTPVLGLDVAPVEPHLPLQFDATGDWSRATAGGSSSSPSFVRNPQYRLVLSASSPLTLLLCVDDDNVPVRVDLVWGCGRRVATVARRDLVASSGAYQRRCALASVHHSPLAAGTYTVALSTFEPGQCARYVLRVAAAVPITLDPIPPEDAGLLRTTLSPLLLDGPPAEAIDAGTLCRCALLAVPPNNTRVRLVVQAVEQRGTTVSTVTAIATAAAAAAASAATLRVTLERLPHGPGPGGSEVLASTGHGAFQALPVAGLRTAEVILARASPYSHHSLRLAAEMLWFRIVVDMRNVRHIPGVGIQVDILSSDRVKVHPWEPL